MKNRAAMISRRILFNSCLKSSALASASFHDVHFISFRFNFDNVNHQIRHFSRKPRFDFKCIHEPDDAAKDIFNELRSKGLQPDVITFNILIGALCQVGQTEETQDLLKQKVNDGCLPNSVTYNVFVQGLLKMNKIDDAIPFLEEMERKGFTLDATTYSMLIERLQAEGKDGIIFGKIKKLIPRNLLYLNSAFV